jgi:trehalose synthase-fused probable maltokinase
MPDLTQRLDEEQLRDWLSQQRWYASKTRELTGIEILEQAELDDGLVLAFVLARFATGTHDLYQVTVAVDDGDIAFDGLADPTRARGLLRRIETGEDLLTDEGRFSFRTVGSLPESPDEPEVRPVEKEQSNSSLVFADRLVLKVFRKLEPGINPELEMLRFLTGRDYPNIAPLHGWYEYEGQSLNATLGVVQEFVPDGIDGWTLALDEVPSNPERFLDRLEQLGIATAELHNALATDPVDPAFSPEEPSAESFSLLRATIDEDIEQTFLHLPESNELLAPILGRGPEVQEQLAMRSQIGTGGKHIRIHGDYHLGQTLSTPRGWVILDFEGEPARPLPERRGKRSPLRDVASMLRSFAYVASAVALQRGQVVPPDFENRARDRFLEAYFAVIDRGLLPPGEAAIASMLAIYELEKAIYELTYELDNRPDWVQIPVASIVRLLEQA